MSWFKTIEPQETDMQARIILCIDEFEEWIFGGESSENRTVAELIVCGETAEVEINCRIEAIKR